MRSACEVQCYCLSCSKQSPPPCPLPDVIVVVILLFFIIIIRITIVVVLILLFCTKHLYRHAIALLSGALLQRPNHRDQQRYVSRLDQPLMMMIIIHISYITDTVLRKNFTQNNFTLPENVLMQEEHC